MKIDTSSTTVRRRKPIVVRELPLKSSRHYTIVKKLGSGRTGDVFLAKYTLSAPKQKPRRRMGRHVAIKIFRDDFQGRAECDIQPYLLHANIVKSYRAFIWEEKTYVVYELCAKGSLRHMVQARGPVPEDAARPMFVQLAGAIKYIHSQGVMHRDLKLENLFLDECGNVKVGDFSHAAYTQQNNSARAACGTLGYMAPEMFTSEEKGYGVDIWSLGVIFFYILGGSPPFYVSGCEASCCKVRGGHKGVPDPVEHDQRIRDKICTYDYEWPAEPISSAAKGLINRLLVRHECRLTPDDTVEESFFASEQLSVYKLQAGVGRDETGNLNPCVGGRRVRGSEGFWASVF